MEHHGLFAPMDFWMEVSSEKIKDLNGIFSSHAWLARQFAAIEKIMGRSWEYKHPPVVSSVFALWWDLDQFSFFGRWWHRALKGRNMCGTCLATSTGPTKYIYIHFSCALWINTHRRGQSWSEHDKHCQLPVPKSFRITWNIHQFPRYIQGKVFVMDLYGYMSYTPWWIPSQADCWLTSFVSVSWAPWWSSTDILEPFFEFPLGFGCITLAV